MIVVDSSVIVAIVRHEPEAAVFVSLLSATSGSIISAVTLVETTMVVIGRRLGAHPDEIGSLLTTLGIETVDVTVAHAADAVNAFVRYGKGRHPASLNLADCFSYGLAKALNAPLLYKGRDFSQTDIEPAWMP